MSPAVSVYRHEKCFNGYTLFCETVEDPSEVPEGRAPIYLVDMEGGPVHVWHVETAVQSFCRLLPDGNLLYPTRDRSELAEAGLRELDPHSNVLWYHHCRIDHDFQVLGNGHLLLHCIADYPWPELGPGLKRHPTIVQIDRNGAPQWVWRGEEHAAALEDVLPRKSWEHFRDRVRNEFTFDWAHNNGCHVVPSNRAWEREKATDGPVRFRPGNVVFSYRNVDIMGVIDRPTGQVVWAWGPSVLDGPHDARMLETGNLLIFEDGAVRGYSRVIEVNPLTEEIEWEYKGDPPESFYSESIGGAQRLPNGNTLICEGSKSHLFEVTPGGEVVWDFVNPFGREGGSGNVYRCRRYSPGYVQPLLDRAGKA